MSRGILFPTALVFVLHASLFAFAGDQAAIADAAPTYTSSSVVNAATQLPTDLARYTIATVYGQNLSFTTRSISTLDTGGSLMPFQLDGVGVLVYNLPTPVFFVSPTQINFIIPYDLTPGDYPLRVSRQGYTGLPVTIHIGAFAPGFFVYNGNTLIATHADGKLLSADNPAQAGEVIVLYLVGLGPTQFPQSLFSIPSRAQQLAESTPIGLLLDGTPLGSSAILYAGLTPGCAGLYQINIRLPAGLSPSPKVIVQVGTVSSPEAVLAAVSQ